MAKSGWEKWKSKKKREVKNKAKKSHWGYFVVAIVLLICLQLVLSFDFVNPEQLVFENQVMRNVFDDMDIFVKGIGSDYKVISGNGNIFAFNGGKIFFVLSIHLLTELVDNIVLCQSWHFEYEFGVGMIVKQCRIPVFLYPVGFPCMFGKHIAQMVFPPDNGGEKFGGLASGFSGFSGGDG